MENRTRMVLPIAGKIQHGEKRQNKVVELKRFIAKTQNETMQFLADRFNEKYPNCNRLKIRIFDEEPLYTRYARYNQSGIACYCKETEELAKQKTSNGWQEVKCLESCEYRQRDKNGKYACNLEGILKFMLPDICNDMIWIMQIKGYTSVTRLRDYFFFQKQLGNSVKGDYFISLNEEIQPTAAGTFKNQILSIVKSDNMQNQTVNSNVSTNNTENVEKDANNEKNRLISDEKTTTKQSKSTKKEESKPKTRTKKVEQVNTTQANQNTPQKQQSIAQEQIETIDESKLKENDIKDIYYFVSSKFMQFKKDGQMKDYLSLTVANSEDKQLNVIIPPKFTDDLSECDLGTILYMKLEEKEKYALPKEIKYINKCIKKAAA